VTNFIENPNVKFHKNPSVRIHVDRQTDGRTDISKLLVASRSCFGKALKEWTLLAWAYMSCFMDWRYVWSKLLAWRLHGVRPPYKTVFDYTEPVFLKEQFHSSCKIHHFYKNSSVNNKVLSLVRVVCCARSINFSPFHSVFKIHFCSNLWRTLLVPVFSSVFALSAVWILNCHACYIPCTGSDNLR
jgi:hypothetical protein